MFSTLETQKVHCLCITNALGQVGNQIGLCGPGVREQLRLLQNRLRGGGLFVGRIYDDSKALSGSDALSKLTSVAAKVIEKGKGLLPDNDPVQPGVIKIVSKENVVRDGDF